MEKFLKVLIVSALFAVLGCSPKPAEATAVRVVVDDALTANGSVLTSTHILRACRDARLKKAKYLIIEFDSLTYNIDLLDLAADELQILRSQGITTIAHIKGRCWGAALFLALHCSEISASNMASISPFGGNSNREPQRPNDEKQVLKIKEALMSAADRGGHNSFVISSFFDTSSLLLVNLLEKTNDPNEKHRSFTIPGRKGVFYLLDKTNADKYRTAYAGILLGIEPFSKDLPDMMSGSLLLSSGLLSDSDTVLSTVNLAASNPPIQVAWYEHLAVFLYMPVILFLLLTFGFLALFIELHAPGTFIGGALSLLFFGLFFWSTMYVGTAGLVELGLFLVAVLFLVIEIMVIPGFGIVGLIGVLILFYALFATIIPGLLPYISSSPYDTHIFGLNRMGLGLLVVTSSFIAVFSGALLIARFLPTIPILEKLVHQKTVPESKYEGLQEKAPVLLGQFGITVTDLRPAGKIEIDGRVFDAQSQGELIDRGKKVKVIEIGFALIVEEC